MSTIKVSKQAKNSKSPHILIVEDEQILNEAYTTILTRHGFTLTSVFNGQEAIEAMDKKTPDLILLDLRMPKMNGIEFLEEIKLKDNYPSVKVVVFSNYDVQRDIDEAFKLGATRYMLKAWASPNELVKLVHDMLGTKQKKLKV